MDETSIKRALGTRGDGVQSRLVARFGARLRPSRLTPGAHVLDEMVELETNVLGGHTGIQFRLPGGVVLQRLGGVDLARLDDELQLAAALDVIDHWSAGMSDPAWSVLAGMDVDVVADQLRESLGRRIDLSGRTFPPISRTGQAYETLAVTVSASRNPSPSDRSITVCMQGPVLCAPAIGDEVSFAVGMSGGLSPTDVEMLEREFDRGAALLLPDRFRSAYTDAFVRAEEEVGGALFPTAWGALAPPTSGVVTPVDDLLDMDGLDLSVREAFFSRVSRPEVARTHRWVTTTWCIDRRYELRMGFDDASVRCAASVAFPNGVRTRSLFGRSILLTRHRSAVADALGRVRDYISMLDEGVRPRG